MVGEAQNNGVVLCLAVFCLICHFPMQKLEKSEDKELIISLLCCMCNSVVYYQFMRCFPKMLMILFIRLFFLI